MQNGDILRMSELEQMFNESLEETGKTDVSYQNQKLKNHLIKHLEVVLGLCIHEIDGNQKLFSAMMYKRGNSSKQD